MHHLAWFAISLLAAWSCALAAPWRPGWAGRRARAFVGRCLAPIVLTCPLLIPPKSIGLRAAAMFVAGELFFKIIEYFRHERRGATPLSARDYLDFLIPLPVLAVVYPDHKRRLALPDRAAPNVLRIFGGAAGALLAVYLLALASRWEVIRASFALNHLMMLLAFVVAIESISRAINGLERLAGFDTRPIIQDTLLAGSVAEFWQRYNYRVHDWLYRHVFLPSGGRRSPVRGVLLAFFVSGVFHEVAFALATSRWTGYQLAFFTLQGPAALATSWLAAHGSLGRLGSRVATLSFLAASSVLFFDGVASIFPFIYVSQSPLP